MKNITLSADDALIDKARKRAIREGTTLNTAFRDWLQSYVTQESGPEDFRNLMKELHYVSPGRSFSRQETNER